MPTLGRITASGIIDEALANSQLEHFRRAIRGRIDDHTLVDSDESDELWSVGQHHGLMTPLLDWTYSPYVALFFAFAKEDMEEESENPYRAIYVLNKTFVADDNLCPHIRMFEPRKDDHGRLVNQAGLFTFSPYGSTIENKLTDTLSSEDFHDDELRSATGEEEVGIIAKYICKIYIKNEDRDGCMRHLRRMNVHHASLFPDLIGASEYSNLLVAEERARYELEQSAERAAESTTSAADIENQATVSPPSASVSDTGEVAWFAMLLDNLAENTLDQGRAQLVAEKISTALNTLKTVDWQKRETIQSQMRTRIRVLLRKHSYPENQREAVTGEIMGYLLQEGAQD